MNHPVPLWLWLPLILGADVIAGAFIYLHAYRQGRQSMELPPVSRNPFEHSPFNKEVLRPGDPGYDIALEAMQTGHTVHGLYDSETGEIIEMHHGDGFGDDDPPPHPSPFRGGE